MTHSSSGWATPGARPAPATHWPPKVPAVPSTMRPQRPATPQAAPHRPTAPRPPAAVPTERPRYREVHRVTMPGLLTGAGVAVLWVVVTVLLGVDLRSRMWVMLVASLIAAGAAALLARYGDRGAAAGITAVAGTALAVVGVVVEWQLLGGTWILW